MQGENQEEAGGMRSAGAQEVWAESQGEEEPRESPQERQEGEMMLRALIGLAGPRRPRLLLAFVSVAAMAAFAAPSSLAAGKWHITMSHHNPYGAQGGVDLNTGSGETFARESGFNLYAINVENAGAEPTGTESVGD